MNYNYELVNKHIMNKRFAVLFSCLFSLSTISGCLGAGLFATEDNQISISNPNWNKGDCWEYSVKTMNLEVSTTMVVSVDNDATDYYVGAGSLEDAKRHAVLNHNPALGRIQMSDFAVYENNVPQKILDFPLKESKTWTFSLYGENEFVTSVISIQNGKAEISAVSDSGARISYIFDEEARWLSFFG